ncbi:hypothetical protein LCGC14_0194840 [marine sediment metagenome]|uniref:Uncharacterized protein n=1 Tax=marine sediment metagenome TaxID=412755 RepID=A0A0F9V1Q3_9ZZZZ
MPTNYKYQATQNVSNARKTVGTDNLEGAKAQKTKGKNTNPETGHRSSCNCLDCRRYWARMKTPEFIENHS